MISPCFMYNKLLRFKKMKSQGNKTVHIQGSKLIRSQPVFDLLRVLKPGGQLCIALIFFGLLLLFSTRSFAALALKPDIWNVIGLDGNSPALDSNCKKSIIKLKPTMFAFVVKHIESKDNSITSNFVRA